MAHRLSATQKLELHQALHGYADGHHQLAISTVLQPRDQKTLAALSDISGSGARIPDEGYLTGYPLSGSGVFALARTWPAHEMKRPGCVWTHTLLIDFSDLAALEVLTDLLGLFRKPAELGVAPEYGKPITISVNTGADVTTIAESWARKVIAALYGLPRRRVVLGRSGDEVDRAVLELWSQQWPRLRRSFRFCSFAVTDRSFDRNSFDLQVVPVADRSIFTRFADAVIAENDDSTIGQWVDDAIQDLLDPDRFGLRTFFREIGAERGTGREEFRPICRLHRAISSCYKTQSSIHKAISVLQEEFGMGEARLARKTVVNKALDQLEKLDESGFEFLWSNLGSADPDILRDRAARLGELVWKRDPRMLLSILNEGEPINCVLERAMVGLDASDLVTGLAHAPGLLKTALAHRPELVMAPALWERLDGVEDAFRVAKEAHLETDALSAAMVGGRSDLASQAVQALGSGMVLRALSASWDSICDGNRRWLEESVGEPADVARFLSTGSRIPMAMLYALCRVLPPDAVPSEHGDDPWLVSWGSSVGEIEHAAASYMGAYFICRALGRRSTCPGELTRTSFERIHTDAGSGRLMRESWLLMEPRLPWIASWSEWDRCHRIRVGVADLFVDRNLSPVLFGELCEDDQLFSQLVDRVAKSKRGRNYLKRVRRAMYRQGNGRLDARERMLRKRLG